MGFYLFKTKELSHRCHSKSCTWHLWQITFPSILQANSDQSSQHTHEIRKYYLGNVLLVRSPMLKGTEQCSFISVTLSNCTEENLRGNHKCLHISIISYTVWIVPPSWHKLKAGFVQELRRGEGPRCGCGCGWWAGTAEGLCPVGTEIPSGAHAPHLAQPSAGGWIQPNLLQRFPKRNTRFPGLTPGEFAGWDLYLQLNLPHPRAAGGVTDPAPASTVSLDSMVEPTSIHLWCVQRTEGLRKHRLDWLGWYGP